ncbi:hypothetical protein HOK021_28250 [Streptomyces hygroscopicus]|nr:hypothetical protein HOK021_28250 [Streptomyces hygroscopicus]
MAGAFLSRPTCPGPGLGSAVLRTLLDRTDADGLPVRLNVLQGSAARQLYERHGFTVEVQDPIDIYMVRLPEAPFNGQAGRRWWSVQPP